MEAILSTVESLYQTWQQVAPDQLDLLPASGSDRRYVRISAGANTWIACYNLHIQENESFLYFTRHFLSKGIRVPQVLAINAAKTAYIMEDLGDESLLQRLVAEGYTPDVYALFKESVQQLARMQILGDNNLDYTHCITSKEFGKQAILADLLYFKYYFLDTLKLAYDKEKLIEDFGQLSTYLGQTGGNYFMFRDFQSRNIMVNNNRTYFIDYQGGMKGAMQYDLASMLWQAKAQLPEEWKTSLLLDYMNEADRFLPQPLDRIEFIQQYNGFVLLRLLQVLGAYGFRGLFERKAHFLTSIPQALQNLKWFVSHQGTFQHLTTFNAVLSKVVANDILGRFTPVTATPDTPLIISICSFSYRNGIPEDPTSNGGGYVFDCRGIHNPGRYEPYKTLTGRDKPVQDFLEQRTKMPDFLHSVFDVVDTSVEDYLQRNFEHLSVAFGCTGGQHRSVYAADALARHLRNKYKVKVELKHLVQDARNWVNV